MSSPGTTVGHEDIEKGTSDETSTTPFKQKFSRRTKIILFVTLTVLVAAAVVLAVVLPMHLGGGDAVPPQEFVVEGGGGKASYYVADNGYVISGADPVAYFSLDDKNAPHVAGKIGEIEAEHHGAKFAFSTEENKATFLADPAKYLPRYGGWCAYAMTFGAYVSTDPDAWDIVNGTLYTNFDKPTQDKWRANQQDFIADADKFWQRQEWVN
ncbi:unnamed protein product [Vitrella brassicaformis CCMP3155]|uniref:YHS domain-containing protein n=2 Tax=Vitrella brassicaformis TaxID=1169539 RepID=A0A0G4EJB1_VITBC|nr:unnamed protein product [Vitrella brassicaformis CCMP3155]|mmetsp:Transcript_783/g.1696  ORF Transcript_783/g.1696 Transcript_783/m.1696 type:complete len:211 (+) Transcript_783:166-798(+)|eukprot:CEL96065.1 unnamed protein product [Vitrella brassicaformis CCMP3155]